MTKTQKLGIFALHLAVFTVCAAITAGLFMYAFPASDHDSFLPYLISSVGGVVMAVASVIAFAITISILPGLISNETEDYNFGHYLAKGTILLQKKNKTVFILSRPRFFWVSSDEYNSYDILGTIESHDVSIKVCPITKHPKVREVKCVITIEPPATAVAAEKLAAAYNDKYEAPYYDRLVERALYDFCEEHSALLAKLTNPHRDEQQEEFGWWLMNWITPKLEAVGLSCSAARFDFYKD